MRGVLSRSGISRKTKWDLENDRVRKTEEPWWIFNESPDVWFRPGQELPRLTVRQSNVVRAKAAGLVADLTEEQWVEVKQRAEARCAYCGRGSGRLQLEHFIPVSKGGGTTVTNVLLACKLCNTRKWNRDPIAFVLGLASGEFKLKSIRAELNSIGAKYGKPPVSW